MSKKPGDYKIPFDRDGNQMDWQPGVGYSPPDMVDNFVFEDVLVYETYGRGRSSITFTFRRESNGKTVSMFASNLSDALPHMVHGKLSGEFTFIKKGANYGCRKIM